MNCGLFGVFDYDRDWLQPEEPVEEHDPEQYIFRGGHWILIGEDDEYDEWKDNVAMGYE